MTTDIQNLIDKSADSDVGALLSTKESAKRRMIEDPTAANVSSYERASALLEKALDKQKSTIISNSAPEPEPIKFKKLSEVVKWLTDEGYKIKKSKVYLDAKAGFLVGTEDGFTLNDVLAYVHTQSLDKIADNKAGKLDALSEKRLEKEVEKLTVQVQKLTWDMDRDQGKYLLKEDVRIELALKISAFEAGFKHTVATNAQDWVSLVGGISEKSQILVERIHHAIDALLAEFAEVDELDLIITKAEG